MRITIAQINPVVGDLIGNYAKIEEAVYRAAAENSDLVIFPELATTGYPPQDLLEKKWFLAGNEQSVRSITDLSSAVPSVGILFGTPTASNQTGKGLHNSALLIYQGSILAERHKSLLPAYDVFDETRYFDPAVRNLPVPFKDEMLGINICEDAWNDPDFWSGHAPYERNPVSQLARDGATLLVNISASPFHAGKGEVRFRLISRHARKHGLPFVYVNQVGGNDELIFDGSSMICDRLGNLVALAPDFEACTQTVDLAAQHLPMDYPISDNGAVVFQALVLGIRDYVHKCGFTSVILGLSGGIDSALTACLAVQALGCANVVGVAMPSPFSSPESVEDAQQLAANLNIGLKIIPITDTYDAYLKTLAPFFPGSTDITEENLQARIRGNILMAFSNKFGCLVLSTGNKSEIAMGYCTLYGDMSGGLSVLADVPKTMVYAISQYINRDAEIIPQRILTKAPSAELRFDQKDQDDLPPYEILDQILHRYVDENRSAGDIISAGYDEATVTRVIRAVDRNEYKRRQAAPGIKVTAKAFGSGRRMPIAARIQHPAPPPSVE